MSKTEKAPKKEFHRFVRGGSWDYDPQNARADDLGAQLRRGSLSLGLRSIILGFRLVEVLDEQD